MISKVWDSVPNFPYWLRRVSMAEERKSNDEEFSFVKEKIKKQPFLPDQTVPSALLLDVGGGSVWRGGLLRVREASAVYGARPW